MEGMGKFKKSQSGQVLLLVVIVMVVVLTIGLSVASRTITNLKLSRQDEDSQKAFQAASAGIDKYINASASNPGQESLQIGTFDTIISNVGAGATSIILNNSEKIDQSRGIDVWLSNYPDYTSPYSGPITVYWGTAGEDDCNPGAGVRTAPAVEMLLLTGARNAPVLTKYVYDICANRRTSNNFTQPPAAPSNVNGTQFLYGAFLGNITNGLIMKIIPVYNSTKVAIIGANPGFPPQGKLIESVGTAGDATRKIVYYESYPQVPNEVFPYAILSQ